MNKKPVKKCPVTVQARGQTLVCAARIKEGSEDDHIHQFVVQRKKTQDDIRRERLLKGGM